MVNETINKLNEEYGIDKENIQRAMFKFIAPAPVPYAVLEMARRQTKFSSIGEFLPMEMLDKYLYEDEADEIEIGENEFVIRDYSLKDYGIKPGDVCLYNPERTDENAYFSAVEIDGCIFPADLNEDEEDPENTVYAPMVPILTSPYIRKKSRCSVRFVPGGILMKLNTDRL